MIYSCIGLLYKDSWLNTKLALLWAVILNLTYPGSWSYLPEDTSIKSLKGATALNCPMLSYHN